MPIRCSTRTALALASGLLLAFSAESARADSLLLNLSTPINGTQPVGNTPWVTLDFESTKAGTVTLTVTNTMQSAEFVSYLLFTTTSKVNLSNLSLSYVSGTQAHSATIAPNQTGTSDIQAGDFNVELTWKGSDPFSGQTKVVYTFTDTKDNITAASFDALSTGTNGGYYAAAKIQGIPPGGGSGSIGTQLAIVPEPSSALLGLIGAAGVGSAAYLRRRRQA